MKDIKKEFKVGDRVEYRSFGKGKIICLFEKVARVVFDKELSQDSICSEYYDIETNGLCVPFDFLSHINDASEQTDIIRMNSRFTTNH